MHQLSIHIENLELIICSKFEQYCLKIEHFMIVDLSKAFVLKIFPNHNYLLLK